MPYAREKFSSWWIVLWTVFFFGGMVLIFSFLLGNPFFSGNITGKYIFSSTDTEASLFLDGKFLSKEHSEGNIELGKKEFCAAKYFSIPRCFQEKIRSNAFSILEKTEITLFPQNFRIDALTNNKTYFDPSLGGLFWIDFEKQVIWGIQKDEESFFSQRIPSQITAENFAVQYQNREKQFIISNTENIRHIVLEIKKNLYI